jgi:hypothetical protein
MVNIVTLIDKAEKLGNSVLVGELKFHPSVETGTRGEEGGVNGEVRSVKEDAPGGVSLGP